MAKKKLTALQKKQFVLLQPIVYKNPDHELFRQTVRPGDVETLSFPHLPDEDIQLLQAMKVIGDPPEMAAEIEDVNNGKDSE